MTRQEHLRSQIRLQVHNIAELNLKIKEGKTREEHLRWQVLVQANEIAQYKAIVLAMRSDTDEDATEILARLRLGESIEDLCARLLDME